MSLSALPLSYCTNVHPGASVAEVESGLDTYTIEMKRRVGGDIAAGLWLARPVVTELLSAPDAAKRFAEGLKRRGLPCYTLNAFPYGDFHSARVKEKVYLPEWSQVERLEYTRQCAMILAELLPQGGEGTISTVPLGFKGFAHPPDFMDGCARNLLELGSFLHRIFRDTGKMIRLAIEPEPMCILETTEEIIAFFNHLSAVAESRGAEGIVALRYLGVCYDVCHQSVEFEDVEASIAALDAAGIRINKVHISCAIQIDRPGENSAGLAALERYIEPRYLHQTLALGEGGKVMRYLDLDGQMVLNPPPEFRNAEMWRVHFHVPVDAERLGPLGTTRGDLKRALSAVAKLPYAPHLEVETYTWEVLPGKEKVELVEGLSREMKATLELLAGFEHRS